jgi:hypothetical protein
LDPRHYVLNRELAIQGEVWQQGNGTLAATAQIPTHTDHAVKRHIHQGAAVETVCGQGPVVFAQRAMVRPVAIRIGNLLEVLLDRANKRV